MTKKYTLLFFLCMSTLYSLPVISGFYKCPRLPLSGRLGENLSDGWKVLPRSNHKFYISANTKKVYTFKKWFGRTVLQKINPSETIIGCCSDFSEDVICLKKKVGKLCYLTEKKENGDFVCRLGIRG